MRADRLSLALDQTGLPPEGRILVLRPAPDGDLSSLPKDRCLMVQGFRPDHDALAARGWSVVPEPEGNEYAAAVIFLPRSRAEARGLVAEATARVVAGGPIWIDGVRTDGIDTALKDIRGRARLSDPYAKAHGKAAFFENPGPAAFADWSPRPTHPLPGFIALPGSFSADGVDAGSAVLAAALPGDLKGRVADLGAGWGWLSSEILKRPKVTALHLVEAEWAALSSARANITDPRADFHWADATALPALPRMDAVVMNPPFHRGRTGDPALGAAFIAAAARLLHASGTLWMVANRHLPYEEVLARHFLHVEEIPGTGAFKLFRAAKPVTKPRDTSHGKPPRPPRRGR